MNTLFVAMMWAALASALVHTQPREVRFDAPDGAKLHADIHPGAAGPGAPVLLLFHQGGGDARGEYAPIIPQLLTHGFNVVAVDLRGGGDRFGTPNRTVDNWKGQKVTYCDEYADVHAALRYLDTTELTGKRVLWGSSYTGALVIRLAAEHPSAVAGVIAFSPAARGPMESCRPELYVDRITVPLLVVRAKAEVAALVDDLQRLVERRGGTFHVAVPGAHGSSALVSSRVGDNVEETWSVVWRFLEQTSGARR
jgi:pimeloyl-ACP methyl ester carboxylesterase